MFLGELSRYFVACYKVNIIDILSDTSAWIFSICG